MKNLRQSIIFQDCMIRLCLATLSIPFLYLNLYSIYLLFGISHVLAGNFFIHSFAFCYKMFLVINFINRLIRNLSTLRFVIFEFANQWANA